MFALLQGLWSYLFSKSELHILIIGLDYAGKTTLLEQLKGMFSNKQGVPIDKIPPTVGLNIAKVNVKNCHIIFWDLGGQARLRTIWSKYYQESQGLVFLVDSNDPNRFEEASKELATLQAHPDLQGIPILILANKQDLQTAVNVQDLSSSLSVEKYDSQPCVALPISAKTKEGVTDAIHWLVDQVKSSDRFRSR